MSEEEREFYEYFGFNPDLVEVIETSHGTIHLLHSELGECKDD